MDFPKALNTGNYFILQNISQVKGIVVGRISNIKNYIFTNRIYIFSKFYSNFKIYE